MSFEGTWNIEIASPMGAQKAKAEFNVEGDALTGTLSSPQGSMAVENGKVNGAQATFIGNATSPMPMKLEYDVTVDGDALSGKVKAGPFGVFPIKGARA